MSDAGFTSTVAGLREAPLSLTGDYATGTRGLAQRFMSLMLSNPEKNVRTYGGGLLKNTFSSTMGEEAIRNTVNISLASVVDMIRRSEKKTDPSDERMGSASLTKITITGRDSLSLEFTITALSGATSTATATI